MGHLVGLPLNPLPLSAELEELEDSGASMDCKKYILPWLQGFQEQEKPSPGV